MNVLQNVFSLKDERYCAMDEWVSELIEIQTENVRDLNIVDMIDDINCQEIECEILALRPGISNNFDEQPASKKRKLSAL